MNQIVNASQMAPASTRFAAVPQDNDLAGGITGGYGLITYKGKVWTIKHQGQEMVLMRPDGDGPRNSIELVILKANPHLSKIWYENGYVEGSNAAPDCSAANGLKPDAGVPKPQHAVCATCPKNQWGSDPRGGKGKACGDSRRLAVVPLQDIPNESLGGPLLLRVPAASLQDLAAFSNQMQAKGYPYYSIGIRIAFDAKESYPKFEFSAIRPLTDAEADVVIGMQKTEAVARVVSEPSPAETAQAAALAAPAEKPLFEQMPGTVQSTVASPAAQPQQAQQPQVTPAPAAAPAPAANPQGQATGFGATAPATAQPAADPKVTGQPAPTIQAGGGFGAVSTAPAQQQPQQAPVTQQPVAQTAPVEQPVVQQTANSGFGAMAPASPAAQTGQSFPGAADGTKPLPQADASFDEALDARLNAIIGPAA